jgi:hypothetical protein
MRRNSLVTDIALAVLAAILVLVIAPGVAIAGLIALLVLFFSVVNVVRPSGKRRARPHGRARRGPPRASK